jgi:hypothetical protein
MARKVSVAVALRVPPEQRAWLERLAQEEWSSMNAIAVRVFRAAMESEQQAGANG